MSRNAQERRSRSAVTLLTLCALLVVFGLVGWRQMTAPGPWSSDAGPTAADCVEGLQEGELVRTTDVTISVYNAGSRSGLAGRTQEELLARGFLPGEIGNAPENLSDVRRVAVLAPSKDDPAATLVARHFGKQMKVRAYQDDLGSGVAVVVGDRFRGLVPAPRRMRAQTDGSGC